MSKIIDIIRNHPKKSAGVAAGLVLGTAMGIFAPYGSGRQEVFSGRVGDWNVVYEEGKKDNCLVARKGKTTITYVDSNYPTGIGLFVKEPIVLADKLESITYEDSKGNSEFVFDGADASRFDADAIKGVFENGDKHYNALRTQIREIKRKESMGRLEEVSRNLK